MVTPGTEKCVLVVAAHPDDEVLGCGGAIAQLTGQGVCVRVAFMADGVSARKDTPAPEADELVARRAAAMKAAEILGAQPPEFFDFKDNQLDSVPLLRIIQRVESLIERYRPDTVFTHHSGDLNVDHRLTHQAVVTACRPMPGSPVSRLLFFEVASSTEWQPPGSAPHFSPNVFMNISEALDTKLAALHAYEMEMRPWPHARSLEAVRHLASWRGASVGVDAAEAFMLGRELMR